MVKLETKAGYSKNGLPYARIGSGPRNLVIFDGLDFAHKPPSGLMLRMTASMFKNFANDFAVYMVRRKPGLPADYSIQDMSNDYATMVRDEFGGPVDIMGISTGGPIAQYFAADHPDLVRHLVLASTGYRLSDYGSQQQRRLISLAEEGKWRATAAVMASLISSGATRLVYASMFWLLGKYFFGSPATPSDGIVELKAEDRHDFKERLVEIKAPTLVIGGEKDPLYLIRETAAGIPNARLILYEKTGHMAIRKSQFSKDVLAFLTETTA